MNQHFAPSHSGVPLLLNQDVFQTNSQLLSQQSRDSEENLIVPWKKVEELVQTNPWLLGKIKMVDGGLC